MAGRDGRESFEPHPCRWGCGTPRPICCAIRGQPQLGLRCFISTTARMSSALGPCGPGFRRRFGENSMRYFCSWLCEGLAVSKASVRLRNGADELDAARARSSRQGCGPTRIDSAIVAGSLLSEPSRMSDFLSQDGRGHTSRPLFIGKWTVKILFSLKKQPYRHGLLRPASRKCFAAHAHQNA